MAILHQFLETSKMKSSESKVCFFADQKLITDPFQQIAILDLIFEANFALNPIWDPNIRKLCELPSTIIYRTYFLLPIASKDHHQIIEKIKKPQV